MLSKSESERTAFGSFDGGQPHDSRILTMLDLSSMTTLEEALPAVARFCQRYREYHGRMVGIRAEARLVQEGTEELFRLVGAVLQQQGAPGYYSFVAGSAVMTDQHVQAILQKYQQPPSSNHHDDFLAYANRRVANRQQPQPQQQQGGWRGFSRGGSSSRGMDSRPTMEPPRQHQRQMTDEELAHRLAEEGSAFLQELEPPPPTTTNQFEPNISSSSIMADEFSSFQPQSTTTRTSIRQESDAELAMRLAFEESSNLSMSLHNECPEPILSFLRQQLHGETPINIETAKSAQQSVLILSYSPSAVDNRFRQQQEAMSSSSSTWYDTLVRGDYNLVVRIWKGGSRWWNLNRQRPPSSSQRSSLANFSITRDEKARVVQDLSRSEIAAYQIAHLVLGDKIPRLLHCCHCNLDDSSEGSFHSWAVFEFVGRGSTRFQQKPTIPEPPDEYNSYWTDTMIKVRHEFGFEEPHPRWGRVPVEHALDYAKVVVKEVTIPLHQWFDSKRGESMVTQNLVRDLVLDGTKLEEVEESNPPVVGYSYGRMLQIYQEAYSDMEVLTMQSSSEERLVKSIRLLGQCIERLKQDWNAHLNPLPFVLVHMDCQPQNLIFANKYSNRHNDLYVSSVLDWEEACYADPRFELLLLGRKVCANTEQAEALWLFYEGLARETGMKIELGPIAPWLRLETVHSICTLLLQSLKQGGRGSPWENKPELWGKISREFERLVACGWEFCNEISTL